MPGTIFISTQVCSMSEATSGLSIAVDIVEALDSMPSEAGIANGGTLVSSGSIVSSGKYGSEYALEKAMVDDGNPNLARSASSGNALCLLEAVRFDEEERLLARIEWNELGLRLPDPSGALLICPGRLTVPDDRPCRTEPDNEDLDDRESKGGLFTIPSVDLIDWGRELTPFEVIGAGMGGKGDAAGSNVNSSSGLTNDSISGRIRKGNLPVR